MAVRASGDGQIHSGAESVGNANRSRDVSGPSEQLACQTLDFCGCLLHTEARTVSEEIAVTVDELDPVGPATFMTVVIRLAFEQDIAWEQLHIAGARNGSSMSTAP